MSAELLFVGLIQPGILQHVTRPLVDWIEREWLYSKHLPEFRGPGAPPADAPEKLPELP
jgi:hypothetical protein